MWKRFLFYMSFSFVVLAFSYIIARVIMVQTGISALPVARLSVISENGGFDRTQIVDSIGLQAGTNLFAVGLSEIQSRVAAIPTIEYSAVRRMPDGAIKVKIRTKTGVAYWTDGTSFYPITNSGERIETQFATRPENTIIFSGAMPSGGIAKIIKLVSANARVANAVDYLDWIENRRWDLHLVGGQLVRLPENGAEAAINTLLDLLTRHQLADRNISVVDLRDPGRILISE
ncbi:MAG: cell division protein FtsQ/DivIB [Rickettsiales bacterium]|jgi:cell division protein FtsQ|nr:cell division protein FtsQ/DivIB [Rickettsiales bacterium]